MSITIASYDRIEAIYEGAKVSLYRAWRDSEHNSVLIKALKAEYPTLEELTQLQYEYKILQSLDIEGIIKPIALSNHHNGLMLILSDFGGESLKQVIANQKFNLEEFIQIAIQMASTLAALHQNNILHKDVQPQNILINTETNQINFFDLSIASYLSREEQTVKPFDLLEGTLAYMSPEQTGRMNRTIDYRTDFYSLGVTFYEMLTGHLPFQVTDSLELIHCHIAKKPTTPRELIPEIPQVLSDIVMKLLAKTAEERYQSALGLKAELEAARARLGSHGKTSFQAGQLDINSKFVISSKLYGRQEEISILMEAFDRVSQGRTEIVLVSGYSGIGKSSLVKEIHKPIVRQQGYFIAGKFDQVKRDIPYLSLIQAFQELIRQLLTDSAEKIAKCKSRTLEALGNNGQVIIDVIPELELIIGQQNVVPQLNSFESQNRFNRVFQQFINVFSQPEHPLVVFLDDLQGADIASLKLIELIMTAPNSQYLLLIGAYRDNEVSVTHPLIHTLEQIQKVGTTMSNIVLRPLDIVHVNQLVSDTLHIDAHKAKELANLVFNKTQGNPFFLTQLLKSLYQENLISFNFVQSCWQWNIDVLQSIDITENVIELMVGQIQKLSQETQHVLKLAACIEKKFTLDILAIVNEKSQSETAKTLWEALQEGLILPLSNA